ncbi:MAG: hypothetical protein HYY93_05985 [Planctomycetes bacterium]|nr:hypothetical protein [Planctomycetota bacterium]
MPQSLVSLSCHIIFGTEDGAAGWWCCDAFGPADEATPAALALQPPSTRPPPAAALAELRAEAEGARRRIEGRARRH